MLLTATDDAVTWLSAVSLNVLLTATDDAVTWLSVVSLTVLLIATEDDRLAMSVPIASSAPLSAKYDARLTVLLRVGSAPRSTMYFRIDATLTIETPKMITAMINIAWDFRVVVASFVSGVLERLGIERVLLMAPRVLGNATTCADCISSIIMPDLATGDAVAINANDFYRIST